MNFKHAYLIIPILLITIPIGSQARNDKIDPPPIIVLPVPLPERLITLETKIEAQQVMIDELVEQNRELLNRVSCIAVKSGTNDFYFKGCNVHVLNGAGQTDSLNGFGNLIIGYNEDNSVSPPSPKDRTGSHNIVVGPNHTYSSYGGSILGTRNAITAPYASVGGGSSNVASGESSSVNGGAFNNASGGFSSVNGGSFNYASGGFSSVNGGSSNNASGILSSVSGGRRNRTNGRFSSVTGGSTNLASGIESSVSGGVSNEANTRGSSVTGGLNNAASGEFSSVSGGSSNVASGKFSSVTGGNQNRAIGEASTVLGGQNEEETFDYGTNP